MNKTAQEARKSIWYCEIYAQESIAQKLRECVNEIERQEKLLQDLAKQLEDVLCDITNALMNDKNEERKNLARELLNKYEARS